MQTTMGDFPWAAFSKASGLTKQKEFVVRQPSYLEALGKLLTESDLETWKNYLRLQVIDGYSSNLTEELELRHFQFHSTLHFQFMSTNRIDRHFLSCMHSKFRNMSFVYACSQVCFSICVL